MSATEDGGPAFPTKGPPHKIITAHGEHYEDDNHGMSIRDYFAAQALSGMLAGGFADTIPHDDVSGGSQAAGFSYMYADAMLAARKIQP